MPHIHTKAGQHDITVSGFIFRTDFEQPKLILHMHKKLNKWLQYGGHVELHENPWQALEHELLEESGYELGQLKVLQPAERLKAHPDRRISLHHVPAYMNTHPIDTGEPDLPPHFHTDIGFIFVASDGPRHRPGKGEANEITMVTREELAALPKDDIWQVTAEIGFFGFDVCLPGWERVSL